MRRPLADHGEAIRLNPRNAGGYFFRGLAWFEKKEYDKAIGRPQRSHPTRPLGMPWRLFLPRQRLVREEGVRQGHWLTSMRPSAWA